MQTYLKQVRSKSTFSRATAKNDVLTVNIFHKRSFA